MNYTFVQLHLTLICKRIKITYIFEYTIMYQVIQVHIKGRSMSLTKCHVSSHICDSTHFPNL